MIVFEREFATAVALHRAGRLEDAILAYRRGLTVDPSHLFSHWNLALALDQLQSWTLSVVAWQRVLMVEPANMEAAGRLGRALLKAELPSAAIRILRRSLRHPGLDAAGKAVLLAHMVQAAHQSKDWVAMAEAACEELALRPTDQTARYHLALGLHHQGRWLEAQSEYRRILDAVADGAPLTRHQAKARENLARAEQERTPQDLLRYTLPELLQSCDRSATAGRLSDAERLCRLVLQQNPEHPGALARLARLGRLSGASDAVTVAEAAVAVAPTAAHRQLHAWTLQGAGCLDEAIQVLDGLSAGVAKKSVVQVVWQSDPDSLWESAWLRWLLKDLNCEHRTTMPQSVTRDPILIVGGLPTLSQERDHAALAAQGARLGLVLLSDEYYTVPASAYAPFRLILRNYWSERLAADPRSVVFPLGYKQGIASPDPLPDAAARPHNWCFMGNATPPARKEMLHHLKAVSGSFLHLTNSFHDSKALSADAYAAKLRSSVFVPCPGGNNLETFRVYEALECGAIPIVEERFAEPYYNRLLGPCPFPMLRRWADAPALIDGLLASPAALAERQRACMLWWGLTKQYFARTIAIRMQESLID